MSLLGAGSSSSSSSSGDNSDSSSIGSSSLLSRAPASASRSVPAQVRWELQRQVVRHAAAALAMLGEEQENRLQMLMQGAVFCLVQLCEADGSSGSGGSDEWEEDAEILTSAVKCLASLSEPPNGNGGSSSSSGDVMGGESCREHVMNHDGVVKCLIAIMNRNGTTSSSASTSSTSSAETTHFATLALKHLVVDPDPLTVWGRHNYHSLLNEKMHEQGGIGDGSSARWGAGSKVGMGVAALRECRQQCIEAGGVAALARLTESTEGLQRNRMLRMAVAVLLAMAVEGEEEFVQEKQQSVWRRMVQEGAVVLLKQASAAFGADMQMLRVAARALQLVTRCEDAHASGSSKREREEAAVAAVGGGGDGVKGRMVEDGATRSLLSWVAAGVEVREWDVRRGEGERESKREAEKE